MNEDKLIVPDDIILTKIYLLRDQKVMLYRLRSKTADIFHCNHISALLLARHYTRMFES